MEHQFDEAGGGNFAVVLLIRDGTLASGSVWLWLFESLHSAA